MLARYVTDLKHAGSLKTSTSSALYHRFSFKSSLGTPEICWYNRPSFLATSGVADKCKRKADEKDNPREVNFAERPCSMAS